MKVFKEITDRELFQASVQDLDMSGLKCNDYPSFKCKGTISIERVHGQWVDFTGEHGADDYEKEYGFKLRMEP